MPNTADRLRATKTFGDLIHYLEEELDWPLSEFEFEDLTFEYWPAELGLKEEEAAKVKTIHQLRPLHPDQPWGIFFVEFEKKRMPVVVLRRVLSHLVIKKRASANQAQAKAWNLGDLIFISAFGAEATDQREIAFAHFHQDKDGLPTLRVLGWNGADTFLKLENVDATLKQQLRWPSDPDDVDAWRKQWTAIFRHGVGHSIKTADALADRLAELARGIRAAARSLMEHESESGPLRRLHKAFQTALIHDLSEADFADTYAQTITYGLLTNAISRMDIREGRHSSPRIAGDVTDLMPVTNPFLREMLETCLQAGGQQGGINFDELGIQDVVDLLQDENTDLPAIVRNFGNRTQHEDPVIYFYEYFAKRYDPIDKVKRGEFYTPQPAVSYIVRSVHELLQTEFGLEDGLASTVTWGEMATRHPGLKIPSGTNPQSPFVVILDIATGTATFLVKVIDVIYDTLTAKWKQQRLTDEQQCNAWNEYVPEHLLPRLYGFELKMAPYAIAHMRIGLKLWETGYRFGSVERVRVYLTNTLEPATDQGQQLALAGWAPALAHEAQDVNTVKRHQRPTVVIGNPPYSGHSANASEWLEGLLHGIDSDGKRVESYFDVDGHPLGERTAKWLNDDYVKFIRFGQWCVERAGIGILAFITNHGYLNNPTFRGMRQCLMAAFETLYLLDLHGSTKRKETAPDGSLDGNVFDIQQGVAVLTAIRSLSRGAGLSKGSSVHHKDLWGRRDYKYDHLLNSDVATNTWEAVSPRTPFYLFVPQDVDIRDEYMHAWRITDVMPLSGVGMTTARDEFVIEMTPEPLLRRVEAFKESVPVEENLHQRSGIRRKQGWSIRKAWTVLQPLSHEDISQLIVPVSYRPFDSRFIFYHDALVWRTARKVMEHMLCGENIGLVSARSNKSAEMDHFYCTRFIMETKCGESTTQSCLFPLYLYPGATISGLLDSWHSNNTFPNRRPNLHPSFIAALSQRLKLRFTLDTGSSSSQTFSPTDTLHYIYAVFYSPEYRSRYAEFLKIDFPRLPLTSSVDLFRTLTALGGELVALHLMESPKLAKQLTTYTGPANPAIEKVLYAREAVWLDKAQTRGFRGVPEAVWNFHIGGYQVCEKWLKDRKGRTLSPEEIDHYQRIVVALNETIRLMQEIDDVIDAHGGWPIQ